MTITRTILFKVKDDADPDAAKAAGEGFLELKTKCVHPETKAPYILSLKGGKDNSPDGLQNGFTHGFVVEFASAEDRDYYVTKDPAHLEFVKGFGGVLEKLLVLDFSEGVY